MVKEAKVGIELGREHLVVDESPDVMALYDQSRLGELNEGQFNLYHVEGLYLLEKGKIVVSDNKGKPVTPDSYIKRAKKVEPNFWVRYCVFRDLRQRGYIIKTALKFGADFRVYDRGVKPGEDHARWIVYPVYEGETLTWYEWAAKNRVAHSTKKRLLLAVVDDEGEVSYWESKWVRP
jgi:tRNA-intron endonuclease